MASSSSLNETLPTPSIPSPINGHDSSTDQPTTLSEEEPNNGNQQASTPQPRDEEIEAGCGEKRKRVDSTEVPEEKKEDPSLNPLWKTSLCSYFRRFDGLCSHGDTCRYAHGEAELRQKPDKTWDPTSERAKKMKLDSGDGGALGQSNGAAVTREEEEEEEEEEGTIFMADPNDEQIIGDGARFCLVNLPRNWGNDNFRKFLSDEGIIFKSAKKRKGMVLGFVSFETSEQVTNAMEVLDGKSVGNKKLKVADVISRPFEQKDGVGMLPPKTTQRTMKSASATGNPDVCGSSNGFENGDSNDDSLTPGSIVLKGRSARDAVTPLAHMSYADQLEHKKNTLMQSLKTLTRSARKACPNGVSLPEWILKARDIGGLPCKLEGILESPLVNGYRNKCEFSVGYSPEGKPTVGFLLGNFREGVIAVEEPVDCPNVSRIACQYAAIFQECLQHSALPIWNRLNNTGFWRLLTVREGRMPRKAAEEESILADVSEVMLILQVSTLGFDEGLVNRELEKISHAFSTGTSTSSPLPLTAIVVQDHKGISNVAPADAPLRALPILKSETDSGLVEAADVAEPKIHDYISNLRFRISPTAFFQVNTLAAEKLYSLAGDWADLGPDTLLFDICCGTGTIGLTLAHRVGRVVGIEMNASAVSDANRNAEINGIKNCKFVCAKAEDVMGSLLKEYLNLTQKQDEVPNASQMHEGITIDEKDISLDSLPHPEERSAPDLKDEKVVSPCSRNGSQILENHLEKSCTSENEATSVQHFKNVVAIVDPPRGGLHPTVIKALRTHERLRRLVYISCNPESLVANAIELCTPSTDQSKKGNNHNWGWRKMGSAGLARHRAKSMPNSEPFNPIKAMAVDMFPHTSHCELVMLLER